MKQKQTNKNWHDSWNKKNLCMKLQCIWIYIIYVFCNHGYIKMGRTTGTMLQETCTLFFGHRCMSPDYLLWFMYYFQWGTIANSWSSYQKPKWGWLLVSIPGNTDRCRDGEEDQRSRQKYKVGYKDPVAWVGTMLVHRHWWSERWWFAPAQVCLILQWIMLQPLQLTSLLKAVLCIVMSTRYCM